MGFKTGLWGLDVKYRFRDWIFKRLYFKDRILGTRFQGLDFGIRELRFVQSTYLYFYLLFSLDVTFLFQGPGFWGPDFGDQVSGTRFRGPDFGDRILGTRFWNQEAKSIQFFLNLELCSVYIFLLISTSGFQGPGFGDWILESGNWDLFSLHIWTSTFCLHLTLPFFFRDRVFGDRILGTRFRGPDFGDRISGTEFWGPDFGDRILWTGFRGLDFRIRELRFVQSTYYLDFYFLSSLDITFLFQGPGFWGPDFGDQVSGTRFRGPDFGDRILG